MANLKYNKKDKQIVQLARKLKGSNLKTETTIPEDFLEPKIVKFLKKNPNKSFSKIKLLKRFGGF